MIKLLIAFILGIIFATVLITIVLTSHKAGTIFYDDHQLLMSFDDDREYNRLVTKKYILVMCKPFNKPFSVISREEREDK